MTIEFKAWPKTPRLFRDIVITEKVDGSNSAIIFEELAENEVRHPEAVAVISRDGVDYQVAAQSRNRLIFPGKQTDNYGFAAFVQQHAEKLFDLLGTGRHFGEWYGEGVGKRYGDKVRGYRGFALFNVDKHAEVWGDLSDEAGRRVVVEPMPVLYEGKFSESAIRGVAEELKREGSVVVPFHPNPEGIVVFHTQSRQVYKYTFDNNDEAKGQA